MAGTSNITRALARRIGRRVAQKQSNKGKALVGKYVRRNAVLFYVVAVDKGVITIHKVGEPDNVVSKHNLKQWLTKAVTIEEVEPTPREDPTMPNEDDTPATTTADIAPRNGPPPGKKRKKVRADVLKLIRKLMPPMLDKLKKDKAGK